MENMSYCRFENTLRSLKECNDHLEDDLSKSEASARSQLIKLCISISDRYKVDGERKGDYV